MTEQEGHLKKSRGASSPNQCSPRGVCPDQSDERRSIPDATSVQEVFSVSRSGPVYLAEGRGLAPSAPQRDPGCCRVQIAAVHRQVEEEHPMEAPGHPGSARSGRTSRVGTRRGSSHAQCGPARAPEAALPGVYDGQQAQRADCSQQDGRDPAAHAAGSRLGD